MESTDPLEPELQALVRAATRLRLLFFQSEVSAYRPYWPGTWGAPPAPASQLMGSQVHPFTQLARVSTWRLEDDISYQI